MEHEDFDANRPSSGGRDTAPLAKDDVFISFNGEDTGKGFTSHLNAALTRNGIKTNYNDLSNKTGREDHDVLDSLLCFLSIVIFSENYPGSTWCLDELVKLVECKKNQGQMVIPVFYGVDPSTVRKQMGSYAEAFAKHEQEFKDDLEKVQSWRNALTEVASYSGWDCTMNVRTEHEIVEDIAKDVVDKLNRVYVGDLDFQIDKLEKLAQLQQEISQEIHNSENERNYKATLFQ